MDQIFQEKRRLGTNLNNNNNKKRFKRHMVRLQRREVYTDEKSRSEKLSKEKNFYFSPTIHQLQTSSGGYGMLNDSNIQA